MSLLSPPTLGRLIATVRNYLAQPNPVNSTWTDNELKDYINEAVRIYFARIAKNSDGYFTTTTLLDVVANVESIALPTDCFEVKALYIQRTNGYEILEYRNDITNGFLTTIGTSAGNTYSPYYMFMGNNLILRPVPNFSQTGVLRLDYIQFPDQMINGGDAMTNQVSPVFKQLIEMYAVYKAKGKQSMVTGADLTAIPMAQLQAIEAQFIAAIDKRAQYPEFVVPFNPEGFW